MNRAGTIQAGRARVNAAAAIAAVGLGVGASALYWWSGGNRGQGSTRLEAAPPAVQGAPIDSAPLLASDSPATPGPLGTAFLAPTTVSLQVDETATAAGAAGALLDLRTSVTKPQGNSMTAAILAQRQALAAGVAPLGPAPDAAPAQGATAISFQTLGGFNYVVPLPPEGAKPEDAPPVPKNQIPETIKRLDGKQVAIRGFMVPTVFENDGVRSFILVRDQALCCFGVMPKMNEWLDVRMKDDRKAEFFPDRPITVVGKLEVGEQYEGNIVLSVYRMEAATVTP